ncbi:MAG: protein kinase [Saprospiraceae bacterium]|nr:protein kinase [Pyrinomonadaceae bacterium]
MPAIGENFGQYEIISAIGVGGMGEVFLAKDNRLGRKAALKFLAAGLSSQPEHLDRFTREARAASALNHPNICTIYEINETGERPYIAMEFIEGETLAEMIRLRRRTTAQTLAIAVQIVDAMAEAHANGIIHRDIKPANIIVSSAGRAKILDFGLAKRVVPDTDGHSSRFLTQAGMVLGTASYMSPEQARGLEIDARSDIWSFGICLYETLTGKQPFIADTSADTIAAILTHDPEPPSSFFSEIPAELETIVMRSLNRIPDERYQSAAEMLNDLRNLQKRLDIEPAFSDSSERKAAEEAADAFGSATTEVAIPMVTGKDLRRQNLRPNNLSEYYSPIIGREVEIASIISFLRKAEIRLLTMTGIGGTGKTRLAQAIAEEALLSFNDGVFFIEMADVTDPEFIASTIAQPLGVKDPGSLPLLGVLKDHLRDKEMLLVLDNFEQVVDAAPQISDLLSSTNRLKILVTSRSILHVTAETEFAVPPLSTPENAEKLSFEELSRSEAVRLFVERAKTAKANFQLSEENASVVGEICNRLDGLPLAIELAAARVRILSPSSILARLENTLGLLTGGAQDLPKRQQTMRGAVDWSYDLLTEHEKALFRRLSVFAGGLRLDAAEAVVAGAGSAVEIKIVPLTIGELLATDVLDGITSLIDKSLLVQKEQIDGDSRFRMLEVVRDYALESLESADESDAVRRRHAEHFVAFGEQAEPFVQAAQSAKWLDRLEEEHDNLRAAMRWSLENEPAMAVRLAVALRNFWLLHSHLTEGYAWLKAALEKCGEPPADLRFKFMNGLGLAARFQGDYETARKAYADGLAAGMEAGDKQGIALSSRGLGLVAMQQGDVQASKQYFESGLKISRELEDKFGIAISLSFLGDLARTELDSGAARPLFEESLTLFRELDNKSAVSDTLNNLGAAAFGEGDHQAAADHFSEAINTAKALGNKITISCSIDGFAALAAERGDLKRSARLAAAADNMRESIGYKIEPAERGFRDAYIGRVQTAISGDDFAAEYERGRSFGLNDAIFEALENIHSDAKTEFFSNN